MSGHGKQKRAKARSVTEAMVTEMDNVPVDEEFTAFVRITLTCLKDKMDNLVANQANYERKLSDIEERVTRQDTVIAELVGDI